MKTNHAIMEKMEVFYSTEMKHLCSSKDSIKRLKKQFTNWVKIFVHM